MGNSSGYVSKELRDRFATKDVRFLVGVSDTLSCNIGGCSERCEAMNQGSNRLQRVLNYMGHLRNSIPGYEPTYGLFNAGHAPVVAYSSDYFARWAFIEPKHTTYKRLARLAIDE